MSTTILLLSGASLFAHELVLAVLDARSNGLVDQSFDTLLVWLCSLLAAGCCVWLWLTSTVVILTAARGWASESQRQRVRGCPEVVRRVVLVACGVAVVSSLTVPANAARSDTDSSQRGHSLSGPELSGPELSGPELSGLPLPERAALEVLPIRRVQARVTAAAQNERPSSQVRVRPGDTLWGIASRTLAPDAPVGAINSRWHELYELNRAVIGADPNLILPGQQLRLDEA